MLADRATGSAFWVNGVGWALTNAHVVDGCDALNVPGHGRAEVIFADAALDLAALRIESATSTPSLAFRRRPARLAEPVTALGYPLTDQLAPGIKVTTGSVNALRGFQGAESELQISAPIQPGNSGGPLVDRDGAVVGVVVARLGGAETQNVNFAISAGAALGFLAANGIAHAESQPDVPGPGPDPSDVAEAAAAATIMVECSLAASAPPPDRSAPALTSSDAALSGFVVTEGLDVLGDDLRIVPDVDLPRCAGLCDADQQCVAFTYNRDVRACLMKDDARLGSLHASAVGGVRPWLIPEFHLSDMAVIQGTDSPGGDYARLRRVGYLQCHLECATDPRCRAFAWIERNRDCWLKDRLGPLTEIGGVSFGYRR
ncbi:trypsin-like peptidase domain-containing protein [Jannaschia sp. KMU-145]|uniref:trypsin-like peptidase domain-containing protein n=1 Tax=Jannaschia halovivens TaxID=3388667 RepID=UPI00396B0725